MIMRKERGYVLITVLLMLLVLTVIGIAALGTSSIENLLSGNIRLRESNLAQADGCVEISTALIEQAVRLQNTAGFSNIADAGLPAELRSTEFDYSAADNTPDVVCDAGGARSITVDIDKMYEYIIPGSSLEMLAGYEGLGKSSANSTYVFYRINSSGTGLASSSATVGTIYRHMPK